MNNRFRDAASELMLLLVALVAFCSCAGVFLERPQQDATLSAASVGVSGQSFETNSLSSSHENPQPDAASFDTLEREASSLTSSTRRTVRMRLGVANTLITSVARHAFGFERESFFIYREFLTTHIFSRPLYIVLLTLRD